jgi:hypothetical protein
VFHAKVRVWGLVPCGACQAGFGGWEVSHLLCCMILQSYVSRPGNVEPVMPPPLAASPRWSPCRIHSRMMLFACADCMCAGVCGCVGFA